MGFIGFLGVHRLHGLGKVTNGQGQQDSQETQEAHARQGQERHGGGAARDRSCSRHNLRRQEHASTMTRPPPAADGHIARIAQGSRGDICKSGRRNAWRRTLGKVTNGQGQQDSQETQEAHARQGQERHGGGAARDRSCSRHNLRRQEHASTMTRPPPAADGHIWLLESASEDCLGCAFKGSCDPATRSSTA